MSQTQKINRFKYIEAFSAVISCGSISAAAKHLGVSQPAVSQLIKKLEDSVGVPLFVRRNGVIYPTARAESLRDDVDDLLMQLDKIQMQLNFGRSGRPRESMAGGPAGNSLSRVMFYNMKYEGDQKEEDLAL